MSDAIETSTWKRLRHTPLRDLARGRISGRLDVKGRIESSGLPADVQLLIQRLVKSTRLWRMEKADVANELIAHFADGIESGTSVAELVRSFGDEKKAARLIRRAIKRNRPLAWHVARVILWTIGILLAYYVLCAILMVLGRPSVTTDYLAVLNRTPLSAPAEQRAWPIYRQLILDLKLNDYPTIHAGDFSIFDFDEPPYQRDGKHWAELVQWLSTHLEVVQRLRQAGAKPVLGFVYGENGSVKDPELWPKIHGNLGKSADDLGNEPLIMLMLPHLNEIRCLAQILVADARVARAQNEPQRLIDDAAALVGIAHHVHDQSFLVGDLVAMSFFNQACTVIDRAIVHHADMFTDAQLQQMAHLLAKPLRADEMLGFATERYAFYDLVQRMYTDNGHGDGRLTLQGLRAFIQVAGPIFSQDADGQIEVMVGSPVIAASRQDLLRMYDQFADMIEANLHKPERLADWDEFERQVVQMKDSGINELRYKLICVLLPSLSAAHRQAEFILGQRDGLVSGIALEAFRRKNGAYPQALTELTPTLLPAVPEDRITDASLSYRLIGDKPVVYSLGTDRDDDGGRTPTKPADAWNRPWNPKSKSAPRDGDWVLYPQPVEEDGERE